MFLFVGFLRFPFYPKTDNPFFNSSTISPDSGKSPEILPGKLSGNPSAEEDSDESYTMNKRMMQGLRFLKESTEQHHALNQVWEPVKNGDKYGLTTTSGQLFVLDPTGSGLLQYRTVSLSFLRKALEGSGFPETNQTTGKIQRIEAGRPTKPELGQ